MKGSIPSNPLMKRKVLTFSGAAMALAVSFWLLVINAQPNPKNPGTGTPSTNWVGYLVLGEEDSIDHISRGPHPAAKEDIQLGLRSDGVVVWRHTPGKSVMFVPQPSPSPAKPNP